MRRRDYRSDFHVSILGVDVPGDRVGKPFHCAHLLLKSPRETKEERDNETFNGVLHLEQILPLPTPSAVAHYAQEIQAVVVAIDCPLLPGATFSRKFQENFPPHWPRVRPAEAELRKRGYSFFPTTPTTFRAFQGMLLKGWELYWELSARGYSLEGDRRVGACWAIEVYPFAAFEELKGVKGSLPRKTTREGRIERQRLLEGRIKGVPPPEELLLSADALDALVCALTGWFFLQGRTLVLGLHQVGGLIHLPPRDPY